MRRFEEFIEQRHRGRRRELNWQSDDAQMESRRRRVVAFLKRKGVEEAGSYIAEFQAQREESDALLVTATQAFSYAPRGGDLARYEDRVGTADTIWDIYMWAFREAFGHDWGEVPA